MATRLAANDPVIERQDTLGRPISLTSRWTDKSSVLFTGAPGLGVSAQLDNARRAAESSGALVLRIKASHTEPVEHRFAREVADRMGSLRKSFGYWRTRRLRRTARALVRPVGEKSPSPGVRTPPGPLGVFPQVELRLKDRMRLRPPATLNDLADAARAIAEQQGRPAMIVIDDVHRAADRDLAVINELAEHLEAVNRESGQHVVLVMGGREDALDLLHKASRGANGAANDTGRLYDSRQCQVFTEPELRGILRHQLDRVVPPMHRDAYCHPAHQDAMLRAADGNAGRLTDIVDSAIAASGYGRFAINGEMVGRALEVVDTDRQPGYHSIWNSSDPTERHLMMLVAREGDQGLDLAAAARGIAEGDMSTWSDHDVQRWAALDAARQSLDGRGVMDPSPDNQRLVFSDPGMRRWVVEHNPGLLPQPAHQQPAVQLPQHQQLPTHLIPGSPESGQPWASPLPSWGSHIRRPAAALPGHGTGRPVTPIHGGGRPRAAEGGYGRPDGYPGR